MKLSVEVAKALVSRWNTGGTLLGVVLECAPPPPKATHEDWEAAIAKCGFPPFTMLKQEARTWIAAHFANANAALWDGKYELAWKWIASGKDRTPVCKRKIGTEAVKEMKANYRNRLIVDVRARDKRHAWNVCK